MKTFNEAKILQDMESTMDSVVHELIHALDDVTSGSCGVQVGEPEDFGSCFDLIGEYYTWQEKVQAKMKELHPDFDFENF